MAYKAAYLENTSTGENVVIAIGSDVTKTGPYSSVHGALWCDFIFLVIPDLTEEIKTIVTDHPMQLPMCLKVNTSTGEILLRDPADILADYGE